MTNSLSLCVELVEGLLSRIKEVKANREGCERLASLAEQTLKVLRQFKDEDFNESVKIALEFINDALKEAKDAVEKCCKANVFSAMLHRENYSSALTHASTRLQHALFQVPLASLGMNVDIKCDMCDLYYHLHHAKFEERAALAHQEKELKNALEAAFFQHQQGTKEIKKMILGLMEKHIVNRDMLKEQIDRLMHEALYAKKNKENQKEFELNEIITAIKESLEDANKSRNRYQDVETCLCCPITKDIMTDPVIIKETGSTYDKSSITEWFQRGHRNDPLTKVKLISTEFVSDNMLRDVCLTYLGKPESSSNVNIPQEEVFKPQLEPGVYEGHGKFTIDSSTILFWQMMVLEPFGKAVGHTIYKEENVLVHETNLEIGWGEWEDANFKLYYNDDRYTFHGSIGVTINQAESIIKWNGKVAPSKASNQNNHFTLFYHLHDVVMNTWPRPGIYRMENGFIKTESNLAYIAKKLIFF